MCGNLRQGTDVRILISNGRVMQESFKPNRLLEDKGEVGNRPYFSYIALSALAGDQAVQLHVLIMHVLTLRKLGERCGGYEGKERKYIHLYTQAN